LTILAVDDARDGRHTAAPHLPVFCLTCRLEVATKETNVANYRKPTSFEPVMNMATMTAQ
jgi:hypothetical protein